MGSKSDFEKMKPASDVLNEFGVENEIRVISAHRAPELLHEYVKNAQKSGTKVFIAGAGAAAHLAGVIASLTTMPVIGVPVESKSLKGLDSLLSTVQMPSGIPVATVAIDGSKNAGILAVEIIATGDSSLVKKLAEYRADMAEKIKNTKL